MNMKIFLLLLLFSCNLIKAEQYYVNPNTGLDANAGTKTLPLKTINEAARRANLNHNTGNTEIILTEGMHLLTATALFNNDKYTANDRLIIRSEIMPDDTTWTPQKMPVIITLVPLAPGVGGDEARGIQVEVSHATIEGIRFAGSPDYSYKNEKELRRTYPIWRDGKNLDDLLVTQCLFAGNRDVLPLHVGVIANGQGLVVDHCVFFNCKNSVIFWNANGSSHRNAMRYCLVYGNYFTGVWTTKDTNEDFQFDHNLVANCKIAWMRDEDSQRKHKAANSIFANDANVASSFGGKGSTANPSEVGFLTMENVITKGEITIEMDQSKRNYLQLAEGSFGSHLKAGLFKK